ncbi:glycosyltransferase family 2 protein [Anaerospora sp.]|uniref:glycosyltransferase family 2 protein n=1 Tax=Anaerospora sp. TaxID=1960278 RepID=UPI00289BD7C6|nr:glycosyltransferase family 2 protein [Anaerospora sp.]
MNNLISVVIPAYNVGSFIKETLESIQNQTLSNWEAIIVDDGSIDNTIEVIRDFIQHDDRFRLLCQTNGGVSKARNTGILNASGTYLTFLDGDDMWKPDFLEKLLTVFQVSDNNMAYCGYTHLYANGLTRKFSYPYTSGNILVPVIEGGTQLHIGAILVQKELVDRLKLQFTEGCLVGQDQEFIWKLVSSAMVQAVPEELMIYRIRTGSAITAKWKWQKHIHAIYGFKRAAEYILSQSYSQNDKQELQQILYGRIAYKLYRFLWRMIKNGYEDEARQLMINKEYSIYLPYLDASHLKTVDKFKYKIVFSENKVWWKIARLL